MKLPGELIIERSKLTEYLLVWRAENDKSLFLKRLGYSVEHWEELADDIRQMARMQEAVLSRPAPFGGNLYKVVGSLRTFGVVTIWFLQDEQAESCRFVTLYPHAEP